MRIHNLDKIFQPHSIAVVGASEKEGRVGTALMRNLIGHGFSGDIYPINRGYRTIFDRPAYPAITDLDVAVDLAVVATPILTVPEIVGDCAAAGVGGVVIISAGGKEIGEAGKKLESAIQNAAGPSGMRIIGPNCVGIVCSRSKMSASFAHQMPLSGKMAFVSQSGAICTAILDLSIQEKIGFSYFVSLGDMLDVDFGDMIDYLGGEPDVSSIVLYVESLTRFRNFMSAARAVSRVKPIIALKAGRTKAGALAAASHTGALAGEDSIYDAALERAGILRVKTFEELFDCAELLAKQPKPRGPALAIITNAGGPAVMAADTLSDYGHEPATLSEQTLKALNEILPPFWSKRNPIDMLGDASSQLFRQVVKICLDAKEINGLLIISAPQALSDPSATAAALVDFIAGQSIPIITCWVGGAEMQSGRDIFNEAGIATFDTPERAVRAFMNIYRNSVNTKMLQQIPSRLPRKLKFDRQKAAKLIRDKLSSEGGLLSETESKTLLASYGIPINPTETAASAQAAVKIARQIGFPVVLKINSPDITHKTDLGGVVLDLSTDKDVAAAYERIIDNSRARMPQARIQGVSIQPMVKRSGCELILGAKRDRDFGPVILFGMGGTLTEIFKDRALALPPLNRLLARRLMEKTAVFRLLQGYRNLPPSNLELLEEILIRLAQLVTDFSEIKELDINPLIVTGAEARVLDARVLLEAAQTPAPLHLVISAYPDEYEKHVQTDTGIGIFIRPIRPEDAPLMVALFDTLSPQSIYFRFFTPLKRLPHSMLARFTQIDYDRHIALVALPESESIEKLMGVARIISGPNPREAEFAVAVGDPWQGQGIGAALLQQCLLIARERGIEKVNGTVLAENTHMLALGRKLGFRIQKGEGPGEYGLCLDLSRL
jgi:acetyltransferase